MLCNTIVADFVLSSVEDEGLCCCERCFLFEKHAHLRSTNIFSCCSIVLGSQEAASGNVGYIAIITPPVSTIADSSKEWPGTEGECSWRATASLKEHDSSSCVRHP